VLRDGDVHDTAPLVSEDHQHEEHLERYRWHSSLSL
jgi:hypothetical protein